MGVSGGVPAPKRQGKPQPPILSGPPLPPITKQALEKQSMRDAADRARRDNPRRYNQDNSGTRIGHPEAEYIPLPSPKVRQPHLRASPRARRLSSNNNKDQDSSSQPINTLKPYQILIVIILIFNVLFL